MFRFKRYISEQLIQERLVTEDSEAPLRLSASDIAAAGAAAAAAMSKSNKPTDLSYVQRSQFPRETGSRLGFVPGEGIIRYVGGQRPGFQAGASIDPNSSNPANLGRQVSAGLLDPSHLPRTPVMASLGREQRTPATFGRPQTLTGLGSIGPRLANRDAARERLASIQQTRGANILDTVVSGVGREMLRQDLRAGRKGASGRGMNIIGKISNAFLPTQQLTQGVGAAAGRLGRIAQRITNLGRPMGIGVNNPQTAQDEAERQQVLQGAADNELAALRQNPNYQLYSASKQATQRAALGRRLDMETETPEQIRQRMMGTTSPLSTSTRTRVQAASALSGAQQIS